MKFFNPDIFGFIAAALTTVAFLPQVIKTWLTKRGDDVSMTMLILFITGLLFWIIYAVQTNSKPVLIANIITFILNMIILILKLIYEDKNSNKKPNQVII